MAESPAVLPASAWSVEDPQPGIYRSVPFEDYARARAINNSLVKQYYETESAAAVKAAMDEPDVASASKRFGTLFHQALLEPELFRQKVCLGGPINPSTGKEYGTDTKKWAEFEAANPGKIILSNADASDFKAMIRNTAGHPGARRLLLEGTPLREATMCWDYTFNLPDSDEPVSVRCKARPDAVHFGEDLIVDLKTTMHNLSVHALTKLFHDYGYYRASAMYRKGYEVLTGRKPRFQFVVVQRCPPYECVVAEMIEEDERIGWAEFHYFAPMWVQCVRANRYPAAGQYWEHGQVRWGVINVGVPSWKKARFAEGE